MSEENNGKKPLIIKDKKPSVWNTIPRMLKMFKSYENKEYDTFPIATTLGIVIFALYLILPADLIPDVIPFVGIVDDGSVLLFLMMLAQMDLDKFETWSATNKNKAKESENKSPNENQEEINQEDETEIVEE